MEALRVQGATGSAVAFTSALRPSRQSLRSSSQGWASRGSRSAAFSSAASNSRVSAWFRFGKSGFDAQDAGIYGSQGRDDFDKDDVEHYFNYMGMLAVEGTYAKLEALLNTGIHPVDLLLMMAAQEGDRPKIEELLKAGARSDVQNAEGKTAVELAADETIRQLIVDGVKASTSA